MKLQIIETEQYILAVSDEEIKDLQPCLNIAHKQIVIPTDLEWANSNRDNLKTIIAYKPKGNATELDLPLLPEIDVEDDVEKLACDWHKKEYGFLPQLQVIKAYIEGYKAATKVYSEEDLIRAIAMAKMAKTHDGLIDMDAWISNGYEGATPAYTEDEIIQSLKQPKTPKWFVAEMEYQNLDGNWGSYYPFASSAKDSRFKTTTINGKTYLVGHYE
jgi:hypothetical protein